MWTVLLTVCLLQSSLPNFKVVAGSDGGQSSQRVDDVALYTRNPIAVVWIAILSGVALLFGLLGWLTRRKPVLTAMLITAASTCVAMALFEVYRGTDVAPPANLIRYEGTINGAPLAFDKFMIPDDTLGFVPKPRSKVAVLKFFQGSLVYDVVYTIDPGSLRVSPSYDFGNAKGCVLFFGDSFTFGEGVNDDQNYPFLVGLKTGGNYTIYNFAFNGYGPHQMLADLTSGRVADRIHCTPTHVILLCLTNHIERVVGLALWDRHGPRFRIAKDGSVHLEGHFDDPFRLGTWTLPVWVTHTLERSSAWRKLFGSERRTTSADLDLLIAIINSSKEAALERYPGAQFDVIVWDGWDVERARAIEAGGSNGIRNGGLSNAALGQRNSARPVRFLENELGQPIFQLRTPARN